jgi:hypothetical protein
MPTATMETPMYRTVHIANEARIARGTFFSGSLISSAMTATVLNPMNAKKMIAAPDIIPENPFGKNGK